MLRVGLTGGLGSGKSTVGRLLSSYGAHVLDADAIGRSLMEPGQPVFDRIVERFGPGVVLPSGALNRPELARLAFEEGRVEDLNAIVHPAVIAHQARIVDEIAANDPKAVIVVESALIFETRHGAEPGNDPSSEPSAEEEKSPADKQRPSAKSPNGWSRRFDRILLVTAPDDLKISRYTDRTSTREDNRAARAAEARRRLAQQIPDEQKAPMCDFVLSNDAGLPELEAQVLHLWPILRAQAELSR